MRHAYLIIAHNNEPLLQMLISILDDNRNDIYVHIDRKADFDGSTLRTSNSLLTILHERYDARWGDFSLVEAELELLKVAYASGEYSYYHFISGVDLPIKSQDYIHSVCEKNDKLEYIGIAEVSKDELRWRSGHYFLFTREFKSKNLAIRMIRQMYLRLQDLIGYERNDDIELKKGAQWCSITSDFVGHILGKENEIRKRFHNTYCPDEVFIQTLCWNSPFRDRICNPKDEFDSCRRFIKWNDGSLEPIQVSDVRAMYESNRWFARKITRLHDAEEIRRKLFDNE